MSARLRPVALAWLVAAAAGCPSDEKPSPPRAAGGAEAAVWSEDNGSLALPGRAKGFLRLRTEGPSWALEVEQFPPGTRIRLAGSEGVVTDRGWLKLRVPAMASLGKVPVAALAERDVGIDPQLELQVEVPGQPPFATRWRPVRGMRSLAEAVTRELEAGRPVELGGPGAPAADPSVWWPRKRTHLVLGPARTLAEVDWIAVVRDEPAGDPQVCPGSVGGDGKKPDLKVQVVDLNVTLYDRRSARVVDRKLVKAVLECPAQIPAGDEGGAIRQAAPDSDAIAWIRGRRSGRGDGTP